MKAYRVAAHFRFRSKGEYVSENRFAENRKKIKRNRRTLPVEAYFSPTFRCGVKLPIHTKNKQQYVFSNK